MSERDDRAGRTEGDLRATGLVALLIGLVLWVFNFGAHSAGLGVASAICLVGGVVLVIAWLVVRAAKS